MPASRSPSWPLSDSSCRVPGTARPIEVTVITALDPHSREETPLYCSVELLGALRAYNSRVSSILDACHDSIKIPLCRHQARPDSTQGQRRKNPGQRGFAHGQVLSLLPQKFSLEGVRVFGSEGHSARLVPGLCAGRGSEIKAVSATAWWLVSDFCRRLRKRAMGFVRHRFTFVAKSFGFGPLVCCHQGSVSSPTRAHRDPQWWPQLCSLWEGPTARVQSGSWSSDWGPVGQLQSQSLGNQVGKKGQLSPRALLPPLPCDIDALTYVGPQTHSGVDPASCRPSARFPWCAPTRYTAPPRPPCLGLHSP